ncbi:outer membrane protein assembly factor BamB family protein [Frigoriglobus tundricola]|uniref:Pyrrolo-quinoline quinone repeat domain-containing protein n=1 Tax=Frigoriglobus tundricola TaxID=2774151 RepID=A0A6M5YH03_9BACT|nr:PQQ-binding-like beta-propeller repeat protein [Frigoriglobus tundricola]QJW92641.1 hypothetical protein FTUN_0138 [Frigoriglobus tundricola]
MFRLPLFLPAVALALPIAAAPVPKETPVTEWPMFGGTPARNMVNTRDRLVKFPESDPNWEKPEDVQKWENEWVLWKARLGTRTHGSPIVAGGRVYVGTNNAHPRNTRDTEKGPDGKIEAVEKGALMCFDAQTGKFLWQAVHDNLTEDVAPTVCLGWGNAGIPSSPAVIGSRVYYVGHDCRVVCADVNGFADGNQGFHNEKYQDVTDADVIWQYDMRRELKVFTHQVTNCSPLVVGNRVFVCTGNGVGTDDITVPAPNAPTLICLDRETGKLLWKDSSPGKSILHGQWCSPAYAAEPVPQVIHGQGDGWLRAFDTATGKLLWKFDGNRKGAQFELGGTGDRSDFVAAPVVHNGRVYIGTGQDPRDGTGLAHMWCIDLKKAVELGAKAPDRDVSPDLLVRTEKREDEEKVITKPNPASALVWVYGGPDDRTWAPRGFRFGRTLSTVAVVDDIVYAAEFGSYLHCLSASTGELHWQYDMQGSIWGSPYYVDGRVLVATDAGDLFVFRHTNRPDRIDAIEEAKNEPNKQAAKEARAAAYKRLEAKYLLAKVEFPAPIRTTPTVVNGVLYVATDDTLYVLKTK